MLNFVTGATGLVGRHLVENLIVRGDQVRALVRPGSQHSSRLRELGVDIRIGNLRDNATLIAAADGVQRVFHCAALNRDWGPYVDFQGTNVRGTRNVLAAATRAKVERFVFLSTSDVYGFPGRPADEDVDYAPRGFPYVDSKIEAEKLVWGHAKGVGLPVTVIRPGPVYGPGADHMVLGMLGWLHDRSLTLIEEGRHNAGITYVGNLVDAMMLAVSSDNGIGQAYNVSDGSDVTWAEYIHALASLASLPAPRKSRGHRKAYVIASLWERIYDLLGRNERPPLTCMMVERMGTTQELVIDKIVDQLGYKPRVSFQEGLRYTGQWLKQSGALDQLAESQWEPSRRSDVR